MTLAVPAGRTRRELVGAAAGSAAALSALSWPASASADSGPPESNAALLGRALRVEQLVVIAYRRVLASGALEAKVARQVEEILGQELVHVATLERELSALGASPPAPPRDLAAAQRALATHHMYTSLSDLRNQKACLKLLVDVESVVEGAYFRAIGKLTDPRLLRMSAQILGCEAQHWTALASIRHHGDVEIAVPYPFVGGST